MLANVIVVVEPVAVKSRVLAVQPGNPFESLTEKVWDADPAVTSPVLIPLSQFASEASS